jgi:hypothetical protein
MGATQANFHTSSTHAPTIDIETSTGEVRGDYPAERHPGPMRKFRGLFGGRRRGPGRSEEALAALVPCARIARARSGGWYSLAMWQHAGHPLHDHSAGGATAQVASGRRSRAAPTHRRGKIRCTSHRAQPATRATWNARWTVRLHTHSDRGERSSRACARRKHALL